MLPSNLYHYAPFYEASYRSAYSGYYDGVPIVPLSPQGQGVGLTRPRFPRKHDDDKGRKNDSAREDAKTPCQFYLRTGTCAFGNGCRFHHPPNHKPPPLNANGYPIRRGVKVCSYYMRNGACGFGATCKYDHPELPSHKVQSHGRNRMGHRIMAYGEYWPSCTHWYPQPMMSAPYSILPTMYGSGCYGIPIQDTRVMMMMPKAGSFESHSIVSSNTNNNRNAENEEETSECCSEAGCWSY